MTEEQKDILIAKMLDAPASLSEKELELIATDDELRDIQKMSAAISGALTQDIEIDAQREWARFRPRIHCKPSPMRRAMRVAAIFLGIMVVAGVMSKLTDQLFTAEKHPLMAKVDHPDTPLSILLPPGAMPDTITNGTATREYVKCVRGPKHHVANAGISIITQSEDECGNSDLDIDEYLRIQQARIDNDLAMQHAGIIIDELASIQQMCDALGENNGMEIMESTIRQVIMQ